MWAEYINAVSLDEVVKTLSEKQQKARVVAGATDLILEIERGARKGIETLVDISRVSGLDTIRQDENGVIHLGPLVTHNHCVSSKLIRENALPLALACWQVGSPQIRNRGTVAGNLITASPANDSITPLMALGASVTLRSLTGTRVVPLSEFYTGVRKNVMQPDELLVDIFFQAMKKDERGIFVKHALRKAQAISLLNIAVVLRIEKNVIRNATITLGAVAPTIVHAVEAESYLTGKELSKEAIAAAAELVEKACKPIDDIRSSARYRAYMGRILSTRALESIDENHLDVLMPAAPILLWGKQNGHHAGISDQTLHTERGGQAIVTTINGRQYEFKSGSDKTLLRLLREDAGLVGTKEGCAEGECGACTVFLDGKAVMSCMVPAARAHGAQITTIEGVASGDMLHPVQQAFIDEGAVQCGYCTPGFIMSAVKLLEEQPAPTTEQVKQSITGNLCRCTGYYKIVSAIERAARSS